MADGEDNNFDGQDDVTSEDTSGILIQELDPEAQQALGKGVSTCILVIQFM